MRKLLLTLRRKWKHRTKPRFSKGVVVFLLATALLFTVAMIVVFCLYREVPDTLIASFFTAWLGEAGWTALLKNSDNKYSADSEEEGTPEPADSEVPDSIG